MHEKPNSIEELAELREWMKGVPEQLAVQEVGHALLMDREHQGKRAGDVSMQCVVSQKQNSSFFAWMCMYARL